MQAFYRAFCKAEAIIAATFLMLMVGLIFLAGVARMAHNPMNWTIDLATCFFAWACFLCADVAWRNDRLMSIELLTSRLPGRLQRPLVYCNHLLIAGFLIYVIYAGTVLSFISSGRSFRGIPDVSYSWVTASLPVGGALLLATTLLRIRDALRSDGLLRRPEAAHGGLRQS